MILTKVPYLSCNVFFSQFTKKFYLVDAELAVMENTPASHVEIEEEPNESTATPSQDAHNQGNLPILCEHLFLINKLYLYFLDSEPTVIENTQL